MSQLTIDIWVGTMRIAAVVMTILMSIMVIYFYQLFVSSFVKKKLAAYRNGENAFLLLKRLLD